LWRYPHLITGQIGDYFFVWRRGPTKVFLTFFCLGSGDPIIPIYRRLFPGYKAEHEPRIVRKDFMHPCAQSFSRSIPHSAIWDLLPNPDRLEDRDQVITSRDRHIIC
jgi:hypothetical protein